MFIAGPQIFWGLAFLFSILPSVQNPSVLKILRGPE